MGRFGRQPRMEGPACDPTPVVDFVAAPKESSIGDPEWGMYVTPDDPLRDTPEKARRYYEALFNLIEFHPERVNPERIQKASAADIAAAKELLGA